MKMLSRTLCFTIADREGHLKAKLKQWLPDALKLFDCAVALVTSQTHQDVVSILDKQKVKMCRAPSNFHEIGQHRRKSIALGLETSNSKNLFYIDIDHLLRWIENDRSELERILDRITSADLTIIGRDSESSRNQPDRLTATESIVNHIYTLITGDKWDLMMAVRGMSRRAAELIVNSSKVKNIGNDVEWPLLCRSQGMNLKYEAARGLTYKTNRDYARNVVDDLDEDPEAWALRVEIASLHVNAMRPYMSDKDLT